LVEDLRAVPPPDRVPVDEDVVDGHRQDKADLIEAGMPAVVVCPTTHSKSSASSGWPRRTASRSSRRSSGPAW
jgi:hypothetical protein